MKNLYIILVTLLFIGCSENHDKITSFEEMGKKTFDIIRNIESTTYEDFKGYFFSKDQLLNVIDDKLFTTEVIEEIKKMSFEEYHYMYGVYMDGYYNYLIENSKELQFKEFTVRETNKFNIGLEKVYIGTLVTHNVSSGFEEKYKFIFFLNDKYYHLISIHDNFSRSSTPKYITPTDDPDVYN